MFILKRLLNSPTLSRAFTTLTLHPNPVKSYYKNPDEILALCDISDNEIGFMMRRLRVNSPVINRCSSVVLMTPESDFYVQKRKSTKSWCPGYWDLTFGGLVRYGETYQENAEREIEEELSIKNLALDPVYKFLFEDEPSQSKCFCQVFIGMYKGNVKPQYEEVDCVSLMTKDEILKRIKKGDKFTPDGRMAWEGLMKKFGVKLN